jgi:hypothetical protein
LEAKEVAILNICRRRGFLFSIITDRQWSAKKIFIGGGKAKGAAENFTAARETPRRQP